MDIDKKPRKCTNIGAFYFCIGFVVVIVRKMCLKIIFHLKCKICSQLGCAGYIFVKGSIYRIVNGFDDCGNVCGLENREIKIPNCGVSCGTILSVGEEKPSIISRITISGLSLSCS